MAKEFKFFYLFPSPLPTHTHKKIPFFLFQNLNNEYSLNEVNTQNKIRRKGFLRKKKTKKTYSIRIVKKENQELELFILR